jgi:hypothetical protein
MGVESQSRLTAAPGQNYEQIGRRLLPLVTPPQSPVKLYARLALINCSRGPLVRHNLHTWSKREQNYERGE